MKIRNGFVSNSSSSSFVVALDNLNDAENPITISLEMKINLSDYGEIIKDKSAFVNWLEEQGYTNKYPYHKEKDIFNALDNGKIVIIGSFANDAEDTERILCDAGLNNVKFNKPVEVIEGEGGY